MVLAWLVKRIVMALCCSIVGTTSTIAGVQLSLMAKGISMISALQNRPKVLPAIVVGMIAFGFVIQLFVAGPRKKKKIVEVEKKE